MVTNDIMDFFLKYSYKSVPKLLLLFFCIKITHLNLKAIASSYIYNHKYKNKDLKKLKTNQV